MGLESISEPDIDMPSSEEEDEDEFSLGASPRDSPEGSGVAGSVKSEVDTEEDPIAPLTPSAGKPSFDIERMKRSTSTSTQDSLSFDDEDDDEEWADPPEFSSAHLPLTEAEVQPTRAAGSGTPAIAMAPARSTSSTTSKGTSGSGKTARRKKGGSSGSGGAANSKTSRAAPEAQVQYPFPAAADAEDEDEEPVGPPKQPQGKRVPQMRTAKARDGGRTQSGGIRGVLMDDADDF